MEAQFFKLIEVIKEGSIIHLQNINGGRGGGGLEKK